MRQGLSEPEFYGDLVYNLKKIVGSNNFSAQFIKIIYHYKKIGYNINVLHRLHAWWSTQSWLATLLYSLIADSMRVPTYLYMKGLGPDVVSVVEPTRA